MPSTLPLEIQAMVLDILRPWDQDILRVMSLVSPFWRHTSNNARFRTVRVSQNSILAFDALLGTSFSFDAICHHIEEFHLETLRSPDCWSFKQMIALKRVLMLISRQSNVKAFSLTNPGQYYRGSEIVDLMKSPPPFPSISTLRLSGVQFGLPSDFSQVFRIFPQLRVVEMEDVSCNWFLNQEAATSNVAPGYYSMALNLSTVSTHRKRITWGLVQPPPHSSTPEIEEVGRLTSLDVNSALSALGFVLRDLTIRFELDETQTTCSQSLVSALDLSPLRCLKSLSIGSPSRVLSLMSWLPKILRSLPQAEDPALVNLEIHFASSRQFHLDRHAIRALSSALSAPQFQNVDLVHFFVHDAYADARTESVITSTLEDALPEWKERQILRFSFLVRDFPTAQESDVESRNCCTKHGSSSSQPLAEHTL